jgi:orotate phosphoribosyltransferase
MTKQELKKMKDQSFQMIEDLISAGESVEMLQEASFALETLFASYDGKDISTLKRKDIFADLSRIV